MTIRLTRREVLLGAAGTTLAVAAEASVPKRFRFDLVRPDMAVASLDRAHEGLRIANLSDLHVGAATPDGRIVEAVRAVNALEPDLVFLTGDFATAARGPTRRIGRLIAGLTAPTYAVLGNHDHWVDARQVETELRDQGYSVLRNHAVAVEVRGAPVWIVGIDDGHTGHDDVPAAFAGVPGAGTRLVLAHTPATAEKLPADAGLACFSGHTHGGQIQVPAVTDAVGRLVGERYLRGLFQVRGNALYVNSGLGYGRGGMFVRVGAPPEVAVLTLRAAPRTT